MGCWILKQIFISPLKDIFIFKGGTSLSKIFNLIHRFSEDIDLILNWKDNPVGNPMESRNHTKQGKFNEELDNWSCEFIKNSILLEIKKICNGICTAEILENKPDNIIITYPKAFSDPYLRPQILLEIGAKAAWVPHDEYEIKPYIAEHYPKLFKNANAKIIATTPERSFGDNNSLP